jgi:hypothetical protein
MNQTSQSITKLIERALQAYRPDARQLINQISGEQIAPATASRAGALSADDKAKIDAYPDISGLTAGHVLTAIDADTVAFSALPGGGVSSVGLVMPSEIFEVSGSPITTSGDITVTLDNQIANRVFAGPPTGAAAAPTFRALVAADLPAEAVRRASAATANRVAVWSAANEITHYATMTFNGNVLTLPSMGATSNQLEGIRFGDGSTNYGNIQVWNNDTTSILLLNVNRRFNPSTNAWESLNNRAGYTVQIGDNSVRFYNFAAGSNAFNLRVDIDASGNINARTGVYQIAGTQVVAARRTGWAAPTGTATRTTFATGTVTLVQLAERVKALIDDLTAHGLIGA